MIKSKSFKKKDHHILFLITEKTYTQSPNNVATDASQEGHVDVVRVLLANSLRT